ncbi:MAG: RyR domain-containing protein [Candidatus Thorarchaeota archaeon]
MEIEKIAKLCHQVNRAYCKSIGDESHRNWDVCDEWQKESAINGVKYHLENNTTTPEDSHINWLKQKQEEGWKYGEVKDVEKKEHPCFVPYEKLPTEQKSKDYIFKAICDFFKKAE